MAMKTSIQSKILKLIISAILFCSLLVGGIGYYCANDRIGKDAEERLALIGEKEALKISSTLENIEQYVKTFSYVALESLDNFDDLSKDSTRESHTQENLNFIHATIRNVSSAVAVYMRYNPQFTPPTSGIFMAKTSKTSDIQKQIPTDFSKYESTDIEHVGWYYIPVQSGAPIWMNPYENRNIDIYMISYVMPLFKFGKEIGVVGMDIDFRFLTTQISKIKLFKTGYAFLEDKNGNVTYHPTLKMGAKLEETPNLKVIRNDLRNGMKLVLVVPREEFNEERTELTLQIVSIAAVIILLFILISIYFARTITRPLLKLTEAANQMTTGNLDVSFDTNSKDEIGVLSRSFDAARIHIKEYLNYVKGIAYKDALTGVRNKAAFDNHVQELQQQVITNDIQDFGIILLDINGLKSINDSYGHGNGNKLLKNACQIICQTFAHSPVFRIGGDEFAVVLQGNDYINRGNLMNLLQLNMAKSEITGQSAWEKISLAAGFTVYRGINDSINAMLKRADEAMYQNKKEMKAEKQA
ncbi:diguanylate cyclase (GGDEF) domain-containing protein [Fibrobacter sp. UWEL]|nr:diguanylate cyclase (GGDEF) domain-containing protein [Fibrobacter sp. UWEL]